MVRTSPSRTFRQPFARQTFSHQSSHVEPRAKRLIGEGCELRIFDPEVHLSRLLGANRSYIDAHIPHLGSLLCADIEDMIDPSEVILVGLQQSVLDAELQARVRPDQFLLDLVNLPNRDLLRCRYEGVCW